MATKEIGSVPLEFRTEEISEGSTDQIEHPEQPLGVLSNFAGIFKGYGLNQIFRSNTGPPGAMFSPEAASDGVLELNLTQEILTFSRPLGSVPNRSLSQRGTTFLNGVPYTQLINDVGNPISGLYNGYHTGIHFETGIWMTVPVTTADSMLVNSVVRMASISHGVTVSAQCTAPTACTSGPPTIPAVSITPFITGSNPPTLVPVASQNATNRHTKRLPQDLRPFMSAGTITQAILDDPNTVLRNAIAGQTITNTTVFTVSTNPPATQTLGGGTTNIAFRRGPGANTLNAVTTNMTATFWIETVEYKLTIPPCKPSPIPINLMPPPKATQGSPVFKLSLTREITTPITITVTSTQIQYSQIVLLDFAGITWPHVSVSTLVPIEPQPIPASAISGFD